MLWKPRFSPGLEQHVVEPAKLVGTTTLNYEDASRLFAINGGGRIITTEFERSGMSMQM
jgi:hypothetical protein